MIFSVIMNKVHLFIFFSVLVVFLYHQVYCYILQTKRNPVFNCHLFHSFSLSLFFCHLFLTLFQHSFLQNSLQNDYIIAYSSPQWSALQCIMKVNTEKAAMQHIKKKKQKTHKIICYIILNTLQITL